MKRQIQFRKKRTRVLKRRTASKSASDASEAKKLRALAAVGRFRSGLTDLSVKHDQYLAEAFSEW